MAGEPDDSVVSVLDLGTGVVKALVVRPGEPRVRVLAAAAVPVIPPRPDGTRDLDALVAASERALVTAEDAAGVVTVRAAFGITAQRAALVSGEADGDRTRPDVPVTAAELQPLVRRAEQSAQSAARRHDAAEFPTPTALHALNAKVASLDLDGRPVAALGTSTGRAVRLSLAAVFAPTRAVELVSRLAERLDLETHGVFLSSFALTRAIAGTDLAPALVVDMGSELTQVVLAGVGAGALLVAIPLGASSLEARVQEETGLPPADARAAVAAHAAGAGKRTAAGPAAARMVQQLAQHHAEVCVDALGVACEQLGRGGPLPPRVLLCGGGSALPELRDALQGRGWHAGLAFSTPPDVRWLTPRDLPLEVERTVSLPAAVAVPALALAATACGAAPLHGLDAALLRQRAAPRRRGRLG